MIEPFIEDIHNQGQCNSYSLNDSFYGIPRERLYRQSRDAHKPLTREQLFILKGHRPFLNYWFNRYSDLSVKRESDYIKMLEKQYSEAITRRMSWLKAYR